MGKAIRVGDHVACAPAPAGKASSTRIPAGRPPSSPATRKPAGTTTVFVDGKAKATNNWSPGAATRDFGVQTWRIGIGSSGAPKWSHPARGIIDDVRMYKCALTADEIQALFELAR